ncbi:MAG: transporter substrate-binding domain-containing protein [Treponema sp.]|nr:transporter substrate-binding domain-containing protein [Treponema sp.]
MKKVMSIFAAMLLLAGVVVAEDITIATFKGNAQFVPAVTAILSKEGYTVKTTVYEEQGDMIAALAKSETDLCFFLAQPLIAQVKGASFVTARLMNTDFCAVTTNPSVSIKSSADLRKYKTGIVKGHPGHTAAARGVPTIVEAADDISEFKLLANGDVDVIIAVRDLIVPLSRAAGIANPTVCEPPVMKNPTYIGISPKAASKKAALDDIFQKALSDGSWGKELGKLKK